MSSAPYVLQLHDLDHPQGTAYRVHTRAGERFDFVDIKPFAPSAPVEWLWPGKVAIGKVTVIAGAPGSGKTRVAFDLAGRVGGALPWPDGTENRVPAGDVLVVARHEDAGAALARFQEPGAYKRNLLHFRGFWTESSAADHECQRPVAFPFDLNALQLYLDTHASVRLVIIDPISDFCATPKLLAETLHQLQEVANWNQVAVLVTVPANCRIDAQGRLRVTSRWPIEAARSVWGIVPDPDDPSRRLFVASRTNFCQEPDGLVFRLHDEQVAWEAASAISPVDPLGQLTGCEQFLMELLAAGPSPATTVYRLGAERGFTPKELRAAGNRLHAGKGRIGAGRGGHWEWSLPESALPEPAPSFANAQAFAVAAGPEGPADGDLPVCEAPKTLLSPFPLAGEGRTNAPRVGAQGANVSDHSLANPVANQAPATSPPTFERQIDGRGATQAPLQNHLDPTPELDANPVPHCRPLSKRKAKKARRRRARLQARQLEETLPLRGGAGNGRFVPTVLNGAGSAR